MTVLVAVLCGLTWVHLSEASHRQVILGVTPVTNTQVDALLLADADPDQQLELLPPPALHQHTEILVSDDVSQTLRQQWQQDGLIVNVLVPDVTQWVQKEGEGNRVKRDRAVQTPAVQDTTLNHDIYRDYDQIISDVKVLVDSYGPGLIRFDESGSTPPRPRTVEGRILHVIELGKQETGKKKKPVMMLEANIHAREWITAAANLFMIDWLVTNYERDECVRRLLDTFTLLVVPVANPDGYQYSRDNTFARLWRKNRRDNGTCVGVDLNRNFDFKWGSTKPCSSNGYPGPSANSEPETQALIHIFREHQQRMVLYLAVHAYSQVVLLPWAVNSSLVDAHHQTMGNIMAKAMRKEGGLDYGTAKTLKEALGYSANGSSMDWVLNQKLTHSTEGDSKFIALSVELRPSRAAEGRFKGFLLPPHNIVPAGQEYTAGILTAARNYWRVTGHDL